MLRKILAVGMASMISQNQTQNSAALVLGASGRLGRMMRTFWPEPDSLHLHSRRPREGFLTFDAVTDPSAAEAAMAGKTAVFCLSGVTPARMAATGDTFGYNTDVALAAITHARRAGVQRVFLASSAAVYGSAPRPLDETTDCQPVNAYGQAKLEMEQAALALSRETGQPITILRIGNVAGADAVLDEWKANKGMDILPDGSTPRRSYIGPQSLTRVLHQLADAQDLPPVLNIATPGTVEMAALLEAAGLAWSPRKPENPPIAEVALCTRLLEQYVTFGPHDGTAETLVAQWRAYQAQQ